MTKYFGLMLTSAFALLFSAPALAAGSAEGRLDMTATSYGFIALAIFTVAYLLVMGEEKLHLRKSKPVLVAAGIIWTLIGIYY
ncbi:MAG: hypothetical protein Q7I91_01605, partial [Moraxellaceae bacterium]|nr:hypothetical protein [Moraxellaceae bacterium]